MYGKCGSIQDTELVFNQLPKRGVVSWTAMMAAYAEQGAGGKAFQVFEQMQKEGVRPDARTLASALHACGIAAEKEKVSSDGGQSVKLDYLQLGRDIHAEAARLALDSDMFVTSTLVYMYAKCGSITDAEQMFDRMVDMCVQTHQTIVENGLEYRLPVATSLIHAYSKCGSMVDAQRLFDSLSRPDVISWNALLAGYARLGDCNMSIQCYGHMLQSGLKPDRVTFLDLLSACSHAGLVDRGLEYFETMTREYSISADMEHYACVIDLVGRAGLFSKAEILLSQMPIEPGGCAC